MKLIYNTFQKYANILHGNSESQCEQESMEIHVLTGFPGTCPSLAQLSAETLTAHHDNSHETAIRQ